MGSDLYISIDTKDAGSEDRYWRRIFEGPSTFLARNIVVDAFGGGGESTGPDAESLGYLPHAQWDRVHGYPGAPWKDDEPYWIRQLSGQEFVTIVRDKRWQKLQNGDFHDKECSPELRAYASFVEALQTEGLDVRVWCWHSQ